MHVQIPYPPCSNVGPISAAVYLSKANNNTQSAQVWSFEDQVTELYLYRQDDDHIERKVSFHLVYPMVVCLPTQAKVSIYYDTEIRVCVCVCVCRILSHPSPILLIYFAMSHCVVQLPMYVEERMQVLVYMLADEHGGRSL
jgi:hypothetical protein